MNIVYFLKIRQESKIEHECDFCTEEDGGSEIVLVGSVGCGLFEERRKEMGIEERFDIG